ncbi:MAG: M1 family aminopeptidase [Bacteroidia bacterium]|nr:M1 family aminopeptidase [Bacteroidia bacterium]
MPLNLDTIILNAQKSIRVVEIYANGQQAKFLHHPPFLKIYDFPKSQRTKLIIQFESRPPLAKNAPWDGGYVLKHTTDGFYHVGLACQEDGASLWFPCNDLWQDKADSGMLLTVRNIPKPYVAASNGKKISTAADENSGTWIWKVINPIHAYNINITLAPFAHISDTLFSAKANNILTLDYYVLKTDSLKAVRHFTMVKPMMRCFEEKLGPYPFYEDGYKLIQTPYLGMEHQSAVAYGNGYQNGYMGDLKMTGDHEFDFIVVHETLHEWFGNSVTAFDISDMWIHEALTTWAESWYAACLYGNDKQEAYIHKMAYRIMNDAPMAGDPLKHKPGSADMYPKGAMMIQGIKYILKSQEWFDSLGFYICKMYAKKNISAEDLIRLLENKCTVDVRAYFNAYLHSDTPPALVLKLKKKNLYEANWDRAPKNFAFPVFTSSQKKTLLKSGKKIILTIENLEKWKNLQKGYFHYRIIT